MDYFVLHSEYQPTGDQPEAIEALVNGFKESNQFQALLGVTVSGKICPYIVDGMDDMD